MSSRIDHRTPKNIKSLYVYLRKYTGLVVLALVLATINQLFSPLDPLISSVAALSSS